MTFASKYGSWALVVGASDGVGALFAERLAERAVNVVLVARRQALLDEVAAGIRARTGVLTRTLAVDLTDDDATTTIIDGVADLEIGMLVNCAGGDPNYRPFLANPVSAAEALLTRNCLVLLRLCHHFAGKMVERGRGGIVTSAREPLCRADRTWWPTAEPRPSTWCSPRGCGWSCTTRVSTCWA